MRKYLKRWFILFINRLASRYADEIFWSFNGDQGVGQIQMVRSSYGVYLNLPELFDRSAAVALVDLFYRSPEGSEIQPGRPYSIKVWAGREFTGAPVHDQLYFPAVAND